MFQIFNEEFGEDLRRQWLGTQLGCDKSQLWHYTKDVLKRLRMAPKASKNKTEDEYKLPDKIPEGTILTTIAKKQLRVGKSIGKQLAMILL